jgi:hypothetical protein
VTRAIGGRRGHPLRPDDHEYSCNSARFLRAPADQLERHLRANSRRLEIGNPGTLKPSQGAEGYQLDTTTSGVTIEAPGAHGFTTAFKRFASSRQVEAEDRGQKALSARGSRGATAVGDSADQ